MRLFHFTCEHAQPRIGERGRLLPNPQIVLGGIPLIWFTDLPNPRREMLGLTSVILGCDRMTYRYEVAAELHRWPEWATSRGIGLTELDVAPGAMPGHWFISQAPIDAVLSQAIANA